MAKPLLKVPKDLTVRCWEWQGYCNDKGVPMKQHAGAPIAARRWLWETLFGAVPEGLCVYGVCGNLRCIHPQHSALGTRTDHVRARSVTQLFWEDVVEIRRLAEDGLDYDRIAGKFDVTRDHIRHIVGKHRWKTKRAKAAAPALG